MEVNLKIGINYRGTPQELHGCINDAKNVQQFLINNWNYKAEDIVLLTDDATNPRQIPTRQNIIEAMHWLVNGAHPHDSLFFHYSGHGGQVKDKDGDELDGFDENLPYRYHTDGRAKGSQVTASHRKEKSTPADVISWSGCKDSQTSADTWEAGVATGAMSFAFMSCLRTNPHQSYQDLLRSIRNILHDRYSQKPQLSSSHPIDTGLQFIM
ncbi:hypothetical protein PHLCEN_2v873 [Hermanssonia centrifuga]|uniref:Peptidase C14 caspase domain-containing protein n=1 Tax=Hermanssonia centrifuga TaxID=98765 RepID=A0A2R6S4Q9_9APHY|nr:hypothetical protein PHLCEN_2v873 [Hermanssonia centrifuga]